MAEKLLTNHGQLSFHFFLGLQFFFISFIQSGLIFFLLFSLVGWNQSEANRTRASHTIEIKTQCSKHIPGAICPNNHQNTNSIETLYKKNGCTLASLTPMQSALGEGKWNGPIKNE